jgi:hypothetical protein
MIKLYLEVVAQDLRYIGRDFPPYSVLCGYHNPQPEVIGEGGERGRVCASTHRTRRCPCNHVHHPNSRPTGFGLGVELSEAGDIALVAVRKFGEKEIGVDAHVVQIRIAF